MSTLLKLESWQTLWSCTIPTSKKELSMTDAQNFCRNTRLTALNTLIKTSFILLFLFSLPAFETHATALAQSTVDGDWEGTLRFPGGSLPLVLHINLNGDSTVDSPSQ